MIPSIGRIPSPAGSSRKINPDKMAMPTATIAIGNTQREITCM